MCCEQNPTWDPPEQNGETFSVPESHNSAAGSLKFSVDPRHTLPKLGRGDLLQLRKRTQKYTSVAADYFGFGSGRAHCPVRRPALQSVCGYVQKISCVSDSYSILFFSFSLDAHARIYTHSQMRSRWPLLRSRSEMRAALFHIPCIFMMSKARFRCAA